MTVFQGAPEGELDGLLVVGDGRGSSYDGAALTDTLQVGEGGMGPGVPTDDLTFQIDAKLGRLTKSYIVRESTRSYLTGGTTFSRRDLLGGARKGFRRYSLLPFFFNDACEAKHGCTKCIDACPGKALHLDDNSVALSEADCSACGLCAAVCPVGAVQMPELSDAALIGLLDEIDEAAAPRKTLVLTCDGKALKRRPWMVVEQVGSIGMLGPRQLAAAAATSLGGVAVVCPDGKCVGKETAMAAVDALSGAVAGTASSPFVVFVQGTEGIEKLEGLHESSAARAARGPRTGDKWKDYIGDLAGVIPPDGAASGLMLSALSVAESCTLCSACAKSCPHDSLRMDDGHLYFSASTCTGCGACVSTCPEHSMAVKEASRSFSRLMKAETVYQDEVVACERCGAPLGSVKFVNKIAALLGPDAKMVKYCPACKKQLVVESLFGGRKNA